MNEKPIVNPYTFEEEPWIMKRYEKIASFIRGKKVLDLGCGKGRLKMVAGKNIDFCGIDIEEKNIKTCKNLGYVSVLCLNIDTENKLPAEDKYFSTVACLDILEHLYDPAKTLKEINRILQDNGRLIISCPNMGFILFRILLLFGIFSDIEIPQKIVNSHIRFYTIRRMKNILRLCGFETKKVFGFTPTPFPKIVSEPINFFAKILPKLFGYNFVIVAEKAGLPSEISLMRKKSILKQIISAVKWG